MKDFPRYIFFFYMKLKMATWNCKGLDPDDLNAKKIGTVNNG